MTGYTVHTGTSKSFVSGWDRVFGSQTPKKKATKASAAAAKKQNKNRNRKK